MLLVLCIYTNDTISLNIHNSFSIHIYLWTCCCLLLLCTCCVARILRRCIRFPMKCSPFNEHVFSFHFSVAPRWTTNNCEAKINLQTSCDNSSNNTTNLWTQTDDRLHCENNEGKNEIYFIWYFGGLLNAYIAIIAEILALQTNGRYDNAAVHKTERKKTFFPFFNG